MTRNGRGKGPPNATARGHAIQSWWAGLSEPGRHAARHALNGADIPRALFLQLADAGVLSVTDDYCARVRCGGPTFPMPNDIGTYIVQHTT